MSDVGTVGDNFRVVFLLEPEKEDGGIQPSRVCDDDFHDACGIGENRGFGKTGCCLKRGADVVVCFARAESRFLKEGDDEVEALADFSGFQKALAIVGIVDELLGDGVGRGSCCR